MKTAILTALTILSFAAPVKSEPITAQQTLEVQKVIQTSRNLSELLGYTMPPTVLLDTVMLDVVEAKVITNCGISSIECQKAITAAQYVHLEIAKKIGL